METNKAICRSLTTKAHRTVRRHRHGRRRRHGHRRVRSPRTVAAATVILSSLVAAPAAPAAAPAEAPAEARDGFGQSGRYTLVRKATASADPTTAPMDLGADPMDLGATAFAVEKSVADKAGIGDLSEPVAVHHDSIQLRDLLAHLIPDGWELRLEIPKRETRQIIAFHAETSRRRALDDLLKKLNLRGSFYPGAGLLLVSKP